MKKNSKIIITVSLALFLAIGLLAGCREAGTSGTSSGQTEDEQSVTQPSAKKKKIAYSVQGADDSFTLYMLTGAKYYADQNGLNDIYDIVYLDAAHKADVQVTQVETVIADGADVLVIGPVDSAGSAPCIEEAVKAGIPVITVNSLVDNQDKVTAHVGSDDVVAGNMQMEEAAKLLGGKGNIGILQGTAGHSAVVQRQKGYEETIKEYPDMEIVATQDTQWATDKAQSTTENWIQSGMDIDAIICMADCIALGASNAVEASGMHGQTKVIGINADKEALDYIKADMMDATFFQDGMGQGEWALRLAVDYLEGKTIEDKWIPFELVDGSNIDQFLQSTQEREAILKEYITQ